MAARCAPQGLSRFRLLGRLAALVGHGVRPAPTREQHVEDVEVDRPRRSIASLGANLLLLLLEPLRLRDLGEPLPGGLELGQVPLKEGDGPQSVIDEIRRVLRGTPASRSGMARDD